MLADRTDISISTTERWPYMPSDTEPFTSASAQPTSTVDGPSVQVSNNPPAAWTVVSAGLLPLGS